MENVRERVGKNLRCIRQAFKLTLAEAAKNFGITASALSHYELGRSEPSLTILVKICKFYDVKLDRLVYTDITKDLNAEEMEKLQVASQFFHKLKMVI